jgi:hypothetical protein
MAKDGELMALSKPIIVYTCPKCHYAVSSEGYATLKCERCKKEMTDDFVLVAKQTVPRAVQRLHFQDILAAQVHHVLNQDLDKQNDLHQGKWSGKEFEYSDFEKWIAVHALPESATRLLGGVRYLQIAQNVQRERF